MTVVPAAARWDRRAAAQDWGRGGKSAVDYLCSS